MRGTMEQEIRLLCSGYGAETGSDLLAVKLFENTETGEVSKAHPARLSGQIYLRRQSSGNSKRTIFSGSYFTKFQYLLRIKGGGQADAIGPFGNRLSGDSLIFCTGVRPMPGI